MPQLEADTILPSQFSLGSTPLGRVEGERMLMIAILEDALDCARSISTLNTKHKAITITEKNTLRDEARAWFLDDESMALHSFRTICHALGLTPDGIREQLLAKNWATPSLRAVTRGQRHSVVKKSKSRPAHRPPSPYGARYVA